jgi:hypothetical protein
MAKPMLATAKTDLKFFIVNKIKIVLVIKYLNFGCKITTYFYIDKEKRQKKQAQGVIFTPYAHYLTFTNSFLAFFAQLKQQNIFGKLLYII